MVEKLTLLRDLPIVNAGYSFYLCGERTFEFLPFRPQDRPISEKDWHGQTDLQKFVIRCREKEGWVKVEKAEDGFVDWRPHLEELVPERFRPLLGVVDLLDKLGWEHEELLNVRCCGELVVINTSLGCTDNGHCSKNCGKGFINFTGLMIDGSVARFIDKTYHVDDLRMYAAILP